MTELFKVEGKVAVVTGGSRGIGRMIAEGLVSNGVRVYITARKADACDATAAELSEIGECISIPGDMSTEEGVTAFAAAVSEREDQLDILVNNAGAVWGAPIGEFPDEGFDKVLAI
ncbi:MAG: SDR family NAD(P)-dependent oxidoreductase, partial [Actinomycetota bacterium]